MLYYKQELYLQTVQQDGCALLHVIFLYGGDLPWQKSSLL